MRDRLDELEESDADVVVVTFTKPRNLSNYRRRFAEPFTVVTDQALELYGAFGFGRGSVRRVWGWRAAKQYVQLIGQGKRPERSDEDTLQLGGNVILDASGRVVWVYAGDGPDDRPTVAVLLEQLNGLR